jgi:hypothetical protein
MHVYVSIAEKRAGADDLVKSFAPAEAPHRNHELPVASEAEPDRRAAFRGQE